jgi:hypothetical protein
MRLQLESADETLQPLALPMQVVGDQHYVVDGFGDAPEVLGLFAYMGRMLRLHDKPPARRPLQYSLSSASAASGLEADGLIVHVDGTLYPYEEDWDPRSAWSAADAVSDFVQQVFLVAASGDSEAFLGLWAGKDQDRLRMLAQQSPDGFLGLLEFYSSTSARPIFTMDLGDYVVHFFVRDESPGDLQSLVLELHDGQYWLSEGLYPNVASFVRSDALCRSIQTLWREQGS